MKKFLKITGLIIGSLLGLILVAYLFIYLSMRHRINRQYSFAKESITIIHDSAAIANGKHLMDIRGCNDCHGAHLEGKVLIDDAIMGRLASPNLTHGKGGLPADFSGSDWLMALRHGVDKNGKPLVMMPSHESALFSQNDLNDIIAYAQSLPPANHEMPAIKLGPVIYVLSYLDKFPLLPVEKIDHSKAAQQVAMIPGSVEQGRYLSVTCVGCHRANMKGGEPLAPGMPAIPNLTSTGATGRMNLHQFITVLRTGVKENGQQMSNDNMPWKMTSHYTDDEIKALYTYLHSL